MYVAIKYHCYPQQPKRQTHREVGTQSHGSVSQMRTDMQIARPPKIFVSAVVFILLKGSLKEVLRSK